jgi:hypothetical protein
MKVQEVILRAMDKRITWWQAAEIRFRIAGGSGMRNMTMTDGSTGRAESEAGAAGASRGSAAALPGELLRPERASLSQKLREGQGIGLSCTWVKLALQGAGLVKKARKRSASLVPASPSAPGNALHLDGSRHQWFQDQRWYDLIEV